MNSVRSKRFKSCFDALPEQIQRQAEDVYRRWQETPFHRSLEFKRVGVRLPVYSVRIGRHWRALGVLEGDTIVWFWIGSHADYDLLLRRL